MSDEPERIQVDSLSRHFIDRWIERRGVCPSLEHVNLMLRKGQVLKRGMELYRSIGGRLYQYRTLTEVWIVAEALIVWIDEWKLTAVTVIVPDGSPRKVTGIEHHLRLIPLQGRKKRKLKSRR